MIRNARIKLAAQTLHFADADLEGWYNAAWHGLYRAIAERDEVVANPGGWLVIALVRRAIDDVRHSGHDRRALQANDAVVVDGTVEPDYAQQLDDLDRIRRWRSTARLRLTRRERQAAVLHFIHGYSRIETAGLLGTTPKRADKIFDSITRKTGNLLPAIDDGRWCETERSLMVAFAAGILDPDGERHAVARQHVAECPGCAALVRRQRNAYLIVPAPALASVATLASGGAVGAALGLAEATPGIGVGATGVSAAGGLLGFGGVATKTAVVCASAVCLTGAGVVVERELRPATDRDAAAERRAPRSSSTRTTRSTANVDPIAVQLPTTALDSPARSTLPPSAREQHRPRPQAARSPARRSSPAEERDRRRAAERRQQEDELGIEPSTPSASPPSSPATNTAPPTSSAASPTANPSDGSSAPPANAQPRTSSPSGGGQSEIGIEP